MAESPAIMNTSVHVGQKTSNKVQFAYRRFVKLYVLWKVHERPERYNLAKLPLDSHSGCAISVMIL